MSEENKAIVHRFVEEAFNKGNLEVLDELIAPDYVDYNPLPLEAPNREGLRRGIIKLRRAFPDLAFSVEDTIAEGDKVVIRTVWHGAHTGSEWFRRPASGQVSRSLGIQILRLQDGKIVEHWGATMTTWT
ncbi:MAG TPA: ester cyclase [Dehalococcoidia bacterium]|nr:ester cyclase [Dehalococcoidia bacterium]